MRHSIFSFTLLFFFGSFLHIQQALSCEKADIYKVFRSITVHVSSKQYPFCKTIEADDNLAGCAEMNAPLAHKAFLGLLDDLEKEYGIELTDPLYNDFNKNHIFVSSEATKNVYMTFSKIAEVISNRICAE